MPCRVVHLKCEPYTERIDRLTIWGNPYSTKPSKLANYFVDTLEEALSKYETHLLHSPHLIDKLPTLIGRTLGCWCKSPAHPDRMCHGDVLKYYADKLESGTTIEQIKSGQIPRLFPISKV